MASRSTMRRPRCLVLLLLLGFSVVACSTLPPRGVSSQAPNPSDTVGASGSQEEGFEGEGAFSRTDSHDKRGAEAMGSEGFAGSWDAEIDRVDEAGSDITGRDPDDSMVVIGEGETAGDGAAPQDPNMGDKNAQAVNGEKEEESSDQARLYDAIDFCQKSQDLWREGRQEDAKQCLDQAYQSILEIKLNGDPEIIQQIDDLRFLIAKRILEIYASRFNGVQGNHDEIPLTMNDYVEAEIKRFQGKEREFFLESYARSGRYRPLILEKLKEAGLPLELSWLPLIESGFKVRALSRSRALGLWQFIPSTGYKFGLKRNQWVDERMNVEKSTDAAIDYLKELHGIFGDWTTVLAAYNCGEGTVLRVIRHQRINYLDNFWDLYERLPRETARYVPRYLAVLHIIKNPDLYGFQLVDPDAPLTYQDIKIGWPVKLEDAANEIKVPESVLIELNPELRFKTTPEGYGLKVPPEKAELLLANLSNIPRYTPPKREYVYHRVRPGETLSHIARRYRTSVRSIANANGIVQKNFIRVGQNLKIPAR